MEMDLPITARIPVINPTAKIVFDSAGYRVS
jgi:hypothetical protein